ncbi:MAG: glycosyltransferase, partial [Smithella sp.]
MDLAEKKRIKLLHLKTTAGVGGAETLLEYWPKYLDKERFEQLAIFAENGPLIEKIKKSGMHVYCFPEMMGARGLFEVRKLIRLIRENHIDIMHAHGARVNLWGSLASLCTGVPIISTEHNIDLWRDNGFIFELIDRLSQKVNKYRVGVSQAVCKMLLESGMP